jgi:ribose-phosphate pyrophosphokinase
MRIFSGSSNKKLAEKIAQQLNIPLSPLEIHVFPDGEKRVRVLEKVVDQHVVVVQSTGGDGRSDEYYMELFFIIDALKRSGASEVTVVVPYMGYQRQDHVFREGEVVSSAAIIEMLEAVGANVFIAFDLHSIRIPELFHIPVKHLSALPLFVHKIREYGFDKESVLVSPDMGGNRRIKQMSEMLGNMPHASIVKDRDLASGIVSAQTIEGALKKKAIIVDDMISSGKTIEAAVSLLKKQGVLQILVLAVHPVFSDEAPILLQNLPIEKVVVSDTIEVPKEKQFQKLTILSVANMIAGEIKA